MALLDWASKHDLGGFMWSFKETKLFLYIYMHKRVTCLMSCFLPHAQLLYRISLGIDTIVVVTLKLDDVFVVRTSL